MSDDAKMDRVVAAFKAGGDTAKALRVGDLFTGASPAAEAAGYGQDQLERAAFIQGYLNNLARPVTTDADCRIVQLGEVKS